MEQKPIFIGGLDGSGKTFMRRTLSQHPGLSLTRRTYMWTRFYNRYGALSSPDQLDRCLKDMMEHKPIRDLQPDTEWIRKEFSNDVPSYARLFGLIHEDFARRSGKRRWGDQLAYVERFTDVIFNAYPAAKMIHMIRDPRALRDSWTSNRKRKPGRTGWSTARWMHDARLAERNQRVYSSRYHLVNFEALQADPLGTLRTVCHFLGEEVSPEIVAFLETVQPHAGEDEPGVSYPLYHERGSAEVYPDKSDRTTARLFTQTVARKYLQLFGYPFESIRLTVGGHLRYLLIDLPANYFGMLAWYSFESRKVRQVRLHPAAG
jgi:hypothetical protein